MSARGRRGLRRRESASIDRALLSTLSAMSSWARRDWMMGNRYASVFPEPVAAAKAKLRTGGMNEVSAAVGEDGEEEKSRSKSEPEEEPLWLCLVFSKEAIRSLHPDNNSGIAIFCTGVGPSVNPKPLRLSGSPTTASTNSVSNPNFDHSNAPSVICPSGDNVAGRESSNDVRGAWKGREDFEERLPSLVFGAGAEEVVE
mmetsp:Transcript_4274/g.9577  ORF Transcript_4274/g.9577 Transcript_4274/m.9577 type:complete len:200 (-) Transcript_4274:628-1227(-)